MSRVHLVHYSLSLDAFVTIPTASSRNPPPPPWELSSLKAGTGSVHPYTLAPSTAPGTLKGVCHGKEPSGASHFQARSPASSPPHPQD